MNKTFTSIDEIANLETDHLLYDLSDVELSFHNSEKLVSMLDDLNALHQTIFHDSLLAFYEQVPPEYALSSVKTLEEINGKQYSEILQKGINLIGKDLFQETEQYMEEIDEILEEKEEEIELLSDEWDNIESFIPELMHKYIKENTHLYKPENS